MTITACWMMTAACLAGAEPIERVGWLHQPAYSLDECARLPLRPYYPQPGDVVLMYDQNLFWRAMYKVAFTGAPGHCGIVVQMPDGRMGLFEAGYEMSAWMLVRPVKCKPLEYEGTAWVRQRSVPMTPAQSRRLTAYAMRHDGGRYAGLRFFAQITPFRSRGPLRTEWMGKSRPERARLTCTSAVLEALIYACLIPEETTRPWATYPRDLFFDASPNRYIDRYPPMKSDWLPPSLWLKAADRKPAR